MRILFIFILALSTVYASPAAAGNKKKAERITKEQLLSKDRLFRYTSMKPCWIDKYKYFCCPVRKIVRRATGKGSWTDYCYNSRDELIGTRTFKTNSSARRSAYKAVGGCSLCGSSKMTSKRWNHSYNPRLAPPKKRRR